MTKKGNGDDTASHERHIQKCRLHVDQFLQVGCTFGSKSPRSHKRKTNQAEGAHLLVSQEKRSEEGE